jgi:hypothetical protein
VPAGPVSIVMHVLLTHLGKRLAAAPLNAASVEIPRRIRRLNDSGVDGPRPCGYQRWIGDVRGESALPPIPDELLHAANGREGPKETFNRQAKLET